MFGGTKERTNKMATRKKKAVELANQPSNGWPVINQGTHLTVKTFEDGSTELIWDDAQLLKEVQEAIASAENKTAKPKRSRKGE